MLTLYSMCVYMNFQFYVYTYVHACTLCIDICAILLFTLPATVMLALVFALSSRCQTICTFLIFFQFFFLLLLEVRSMHTSGE